jgi:drug/metabolite transporter (DMT)-like permease
MMGTQWILVGIIALCNTAGDVLNTAGMKRQGEVEEFNLPSLGRMILRIFRNPLVLGGIGAMAVSFFAFLSLLSIADVSFAVPATAISYVLETLLAKYILKEDVDVRRWAAAALVACGVVLLQW